MSKTILTGLRANGDLHLGSYLGAMQPMVNTQKELSEGDRLYMFVPDLHSFTTPIDHGKLYENTLQNIKLFIAAGIDPENKQTVLYRQSQVPAHSELTWILNCFTYFGEASRMIEFKDKSERLGYKSVTVGLFDYPVLMAADILLYRANYIPLGDDQKQHMELTRTIAERVNNKFEKTIFTVPEPWAKQVEFAKRDNSLRILSLSNPENKMSKSITDPKGTINLLDDPEEAAKKVMSATTDSVGEINYDPDNQPGITNLIDIAAYIEERPPADVASEFSGQNQYGDFKKYVASLVKQFLQDFQKRYNEIDDDFVENILGKGEIHANQVANETLESVQRAVGLIK